MVNVKEEVKKYTEDMIRVRHHLHAHPELSCQEYETCKFMQEELKKAGIPFELTPSQRSIVATVKGAFPGKTIVLRADYDALPITEKTGLPFASQVDGVMHACGHDSHAAVGLAAALILNDHKDELHGSFKVLFQEGEEVMFGALHALESGILDDCDNSIMIHTNCGLDTGKFATNYGVRCAKVGDCEINIKGRAGHSSTPDKGINAAIVGAKIVSAFADITAYEIPRDEFVVFSPTVIHSGTKENIIPGECYIHANARYYDNKLDDVLAEAITRKVKGIAESYGAEADVKFTPEGMPMFNEEESTTHAINVIERLFGAENLIRNPAGLFGDDYAFIQDKIPGVQVSVGSAKDGVYTLGHNEKMMVDDGYMPYAAEFISTYVFEYLGVECP